MYYERHVDLVRSNSKEKYHNDPKFRKKKLEGMKIRRDRIKLEKELEMALPRPQLEKEL
jgi:hypothetical protein